ncbi:unnamed protein product, partial [Discosporangium mesarthrocarpum]
AGGGSSRYGATGKVWAWAWLLHRELLLRRSEVLVRGGIRPSATAVTSKGILLMIAQKYSAPSVRSGAMWLGRARTGTHILTRRGQLCSYGHQSHRQIWGTLPSSQWSCPRP